MSFEPSLQQAAEELLARMTAEQSLLSFIELVSPDTKPARHHRLLLEYLEAVESGAIPRLMIFMPPGSAKSKSAGGSCLWHVIGWERSLKEWALDQGWNGRRVSQEAATGILIASLGTLQSHYDRGT